MQPNLQSSRSNFPIVRICLITNYHVSFQPRTLREADFLSEAGHDVRVVCRQVDSGLTLLDRKLLETRNWRLQPVALNRRGESHRRWLVEAARAKAFEQLFRLGIQNETTAAHSYVRGLNAAIEIAASERADWFIAHTQAALPIAMAAVERWHTRLGFDCEDLLAEMGSDPPEVIELLERKYLPFCQYVSVPSAAIGEHLHRLYGIDPVVLYNVFPRALASGMLAPNERANNGSLRLHWFGQTIGQGRGLEEAVQALTLIEEPIELYLRGRVSDQYRSFLESILPRNKDCKIIFQSTLPHDELIKSLSEFDVGLALERPQNSSYGKTVTNKMFAYLLGGLAIAASDTPGQREVLERIPEAGFLYEAGKPELLAQGLKRWLDNREAVRAAQQASWDAARERFCWEIERRRLLDLLESLCSAN